LEDPLDDKIEKIIDIVQHGRILVEKPCLSLVLCFNATEKETPVLELLLTASKKLSSFLISLMRFQVNDIVIILFGEACYIENRCG
jgi:hypothetical protein